MSDQHEATPTLRDEAMGRFPVPDFEDLPEDVQDRIAEETDQAGFTPNVFSAMAHRPEQFRAFFGYYDALHEGSSLAPEEIEMIIVAVSGTNDCYYCIVAHGALLRIFAEAPLLADQIAANHRIADVSEAHRAMLDFAVKLTESPGRVDDTDLERLRGSGFSEAEIWDISSVVAYYNLANRMALVTDMRPNEEFHAMGR
ncbi:alkylhydroperoxidase [Haloglomus irregulare]|jgi:uncharacterized peroxidase-related enzyme|uniref:Alkylhydroperoxidase n=1 Tax=Haloglomus irregulare TaxID=2234134 RepID=A0A554N9B7_9EURY|nr:peroxidase-related enzyme [Haloglomus irregulare]TSD14007.1 alkylhydroperoxidase [Haloglomus irregulare]